MPIGLNIVARSGEAWSPLVRSNEQAHKTVCRYRDILDRLSLCLVCLTADMQPPIGKAPFIDRPEEECSRWCSSRWKANFAEEKQRIVLEQLIFIRRANKKAEPSELSCNNSSTGFKARWLKDRFSAHSPRNASELASKFDSFRDD